MTDMNEQPWVAAKTDPTDPGQPLGDDIRETSIPDADEPAPEPGADEPGDGSTAGQPESGAGNPTKG